MSDKENEWKLLSKVYQILNEEKIFNIDLVGEQVVNFKHPEELKNLLDLSIDKIKLNESEIENLCRDVIRYSVKTGHPNFHNQLFGGVDPYGLAGSWITEALNSSQYTFEVGPVFTLIEDTVIRKALNLFGFENGDGIFAPGGSIANMYGMVLARHKKFPNIKSNGLFGLPHMVAFTSEDSHYSIKKSANWLGIGTANVVIVKTDNYGRMMSHDLEEKIKIVVNEQKVPFFVNATAGTTVLGAFDDFNEISRICIKYSIWMHVDACLGGTAILSKTHKNVLNGIQKSDSISWNPHKTLGAPLQCSLLLIKEKGLLHECNSANAQYLFQQDKFYDVSYDTGDKSVQCGRKVDALKLWLIFKSRGLDEIQNLVDNTFVWAKYFYDRLSGHPGYKLVLDKFQYTNICFWYIPKKMRNAEETNEWWKEIYEIPVKFKKVMVENGNLMVGYTPLSHKNIGNFFRMVVVCHPKPNQKSMDFVIDEIERMVEDYYNKLN